MSGEARQLGENEHIGAPCPACSEPLSADGACWSCDWGPTGEQGPQDYKVIWSELLDEIFEPLGDALDRIEPYSVREQVAPPGQTTRDADHKPREEADKGARAGERGAEA